MLEHCQQLGVLVGRLDDTVVERGVAGRLVHKRVEGGRQPRAFGCGRVLLVGEQVAVERPVGTADVGEQRLVVRHAGHELGVMPPLVHPALGVSVGQVVVDRRVIAEEPAQHRSLGLSVVSRHRQRVANLLELLAAQADARHGQVLGELGGRQVGRPGQRRQDAGAQGVGQARRAQPGGRLVVEPVA